MMLWTNTTAAQVARHSRGHGFQFEVECSVGISEGNLKRAITMFTSSYFSPSSDDYVAAKLSPLIYVDDMFPNKNSTLNAASH
jgi:hypothetical protein